MLNKIQSWLRGPTRTWSWQLSNCLAMGCVDADVIGFHWTVTVYGFVGRKICVAQGRSFTVEEAETAMCSHTLAMRWTIERYTTAPAGVCEEFNIRRWICDFFKVP